MMSGATAARLRRSRAASLADCRVDDGPPPVAFRTGDREPTMPAHFALRPARSLETPMTRRRRRGAGVAAILLAACAATTDARAQTPNLPYGPAPYQLFDWYPPIQIGGVPTQNAPWVVYVHGSGASKTDVADVGQLPLADLYRWNGFAVFAFNWANFASPSGVPSTSG